MSNKKKKQVEYPIMELEEKGKLYLTDDFLMQINYLHARTGKREWSGMLMYEVLKGSIAKPSEFVIRAKHIFLMDIGTSGYTEYNTDEDIVDLYDNIEGSMDMKTGHIHTHHNMDTFFSGTDNGELMENVDKYNYYLSVIVNFEGTYSAKIAFLSDVKTKSKMSYFDDTGKEKIFETIDNKKSMVILNMRIYYDSENKFFFDRYDQVVEKIKKAEEKQKLIGYQHGLGFVGKEVKLLSENSSFDIDDADPTKLTDLQLEHLTRNIVSVTTDMSERRSVYTVLNMVVDKTTSDEMEIYYQLLARNVENIIENFFDQGLTNAEMTAVITEINSSLNRYGGYSGDVGNLVLGINEILTDFLNDYKESVEEDYDIELEDEINKIKKLTFV
jgi:hypothetical protein